MDILLIIVVCIVALMLLYVNIYLLALYCHPEDGGFGASLICKIVVVLGLTLSWCQILLLSVDISNTRSNGGLDMQLAWTIIYIAIFTMVVFFIPISMFYYESDDEKPFCQRICITLAEEVMVLGVSALTVFLCYNWLRQAHVPIEAISVAIDTLMDSNTDLIMPTQVTTQEHITITVSFIIFTAGLMCFIGYFLLILYGGIGLSALPLDLMFSYRIRPVFKSASEALQKKLKLKKIVQDLIGYSMQLKDEEKELGFSAGWWSKRKKSARVENGYKKLLMAVHELEEEYEIFKMELDIGNSNPLTYILKLVLGVILLLITITWWLHILLYVIIQYDGVPASPFLNRMFIDLELYNVNFLGVFFFSLFALYLVWCVTKGNMKLTLPGVFSFHPMKINETWMNSFLFNIMLILLSSIAATHFCTSVFSQYTRLTAIEMMFGVQIRYMVMFSWAFDNRVFEIALFSWSLFVAVVLIGLSVRKPRVLDEIEQRRKNQKGNYETELKEFFIKK